MTGIVNLFNKHLLEVSPQWLGKKMANIKADMETNDRGIGKKLKKQRFDRVFDRIADADSGQTIRRDPHSMNNINNSGKWKSYFRNKAGGRQPGNAWGNPETFDPNKAAGRFTKEFGKEYRKVRPVMLKKAHLDAAKKFFKVI